LSRGIPLAPPHQPPREPDIQIPRSWLLSQQPMVNVQQLNGRGEVGMVVGGIAAKAAGMVVSGVAGVVVDGAKRLVRARVAHEAAVRMTLWGLRGVRAAETGVEMVRLTTADIVSEARERIGEQPLPPNPTPGHTH
jgi:chaperone-like protein